MRVLASHPSTMFDGVIVVLFHALIDAGYSVMFVVDPHVPPGAVMVLNPNRPQEMDGTHQGILFPEGVQN